MSTWTLFLARRGARQHRRLGALVLVVQVAAIALAAAFPALLAAAEQSGVRQALAASTTTGLTIVADRPVGSVARAVRGADRATARLLGDAASATSTATSVSVFGDGAGPSGTARPYLGELPSRAITVSDGSWPAAATDGGVAVAVPRSAAAKLGASVGAVLALRFDGTPVRARVAALYDPADPGGPAWEVDPLDAAGDDPSHVDPAKPYGALIDVVGPLVVAPGTLDRLGVGASRVVVTASPRFTGAGVGALGSLDDRLTSIDQIVAIDAGSGAESVNARTRLGDAVDGVLAQVLITRTIAAAAGLLLVVLAVVVLVRAALLLDAARADERALLAARGAARPQLIALAAWDAVGTAALGVVLGVPLGAVVASVVRGSPTGPPPGSWAAGAAVAALVVVVRLLPRLRPAERTGGRRSRSSGVTRTGADLVLLALAVVLGWQLLTRRVDAAAGVDPVLVAAPAALVLAGALLALRLVPLVGRAGEVAARRARGAVGALVGWELSRRSSRAAATVLLVSLAVATGAFGAISEATWVRSQLDQSAFAVGAPVRVPGDVAALPRQGALLAHGATGAPQPTIRRAVDVTLPGAPGSEPAAPLSGATVLGLTGPARAVLDRGRLQQEGGAAIARLRAQTPAVSGVALPDAPAQLRVDVRVGDSGTAIPGAAAGLRAVTEDPRGLLMTLDLGTAAVDGTAHVLRARLPVSGMRLVGLQLQVLVADPVQYKGNAGGALPLQLLRIDAGGSALRIPSGWSGVGTGGDLRRGLQIPVEPDLRATPSTAAVVGWKPVTEVTSIWTRGLAARVEAKRGGLFAFAFPGVLVPTRIADVVARVPGSGAAPASAPDPDVAVVDQRSLSLFLLQSGDPALQADQWWVDVPPAGVDAYLAAHASVAGGGRGADGAVALAERLTAGPLRLATTQTLHLLLAAAVALGLLGFVVEVIASLDARRHEMAQLRAIGLRRSVLERMLAAESTARVAVGAVLGLLLGTLLGALAAPRLVVGPDGGRPVPTPAVVVPGAELLLLVAGALAAALVAALLITRTFRGLDPARILREGDG